MMGSENRKHIFSNRIQNWETEAKKKAAELMSNIKTTCDLLNMGKACWKSLIVQKLMYASPILNYTRKDISKIQVIENGFYRFPDANGWIHKKCSYKRRNGHI